jgi:hypothetical protein
MGQMRNSHRISVGNAKRRNLLGHLDEDGRIILKWILRKLGVRVWSGFVWLRIRFIGGFCEHGNETSGSVKGGEFLD